MSSRDLDKSPFHSQESTAFLLLRIQKFRSLYNRTAFCTMYSARKMKTFGFSLINPAPAVSATPPATNLVVYRQHRAVDVFSHVLVAYAALSTKRVRGAVAVCFATSGLWRGVGNTAGGVTLPIFNIAKKKFVSPPCCGFNYLYTGGAACSNRLRQF